jgi:hypothetical protein
LVAGVFPTEYFVGLEPLRFLFIWVIVSEEAQGFRSKLLETSKRWAPYLLIWLANIAWLTYYYTLGSYDSYEVEVATDSISLSSVLIGIGEAIWKAGFYVWAQIVPLIVKTVRAPSSLIAIALIVLSFALFFIYLRNLEAVEDRTKTFAVMALVVGVAGILLGRLPSFAAGLPLKLQTSNDRFMISMMIGGSLFIVGFVELWLRNLRWKNFVFALLIALGIGQQWFNANLFRRDWSNQQDLYWQLAWRIPAIQPNTLLMTDQLPVDYETDLSFTAPINWIYAPEYTRSAVPYALIYTEKRLGGTLPSFKPGEPIKVFLRTVHFEGSTSQAIVFHMPRNGCLRVLSSALGDEITLGRQSGYLLKAIPLSNPDLIIVDKNSTAKLPFLVEPQHTWCYYYTKAELARQQDNWQEVIHLYNEATSLRYRPNDPFELLVFIEAQAMTGDFAAAEKLSNDALISDKGIRKGLCEVWKRVQVHGSTLSGNTSSAEKMLADLGCAR